MTDILDRFAKGLSATESHILSNVREYIEWKTRRRGGDFIANRTDEVDTRTYLLHLQLAGRDSADLHRIAISLKRFLEWAEAEGLISRTPSGQLDFDLPSTSGDQMETGQKEAPIDPQERELTRLQALNDLAGCLNRSADMQSALDETLKALVKVTGLRTAWAFLWTEAGTLGHTDTADIPHDFALAARCNLPPGLEADNAHFLSRPPDCHCQRLLREGKLVRAVNVIECSRLQDATSAGGDVRGLLYHASVPIISKGRPLGILNFAADRWEFLTAADLQLLSAAGAQVATAIERARMYDVAESQRVYLERELEMARAVQTSLVPELLPEIPGFSLAAEWRPAREVAGDFYDVFPLPDNRWGLAVADVSGKGAPAALYMAMTRSLIRAEARNNPSPAMTLTRVNRLLLAQSIPGMFVTVFYGVLDPVSRSLIYANAGHDPPLLHQATSEIEELSSTGPLLGVFEELTLREATLNLKRGDAVVAYTDGFTDALNGRGEAYGGARLKAAIHAAKVASTAPGLMQHLLADLAGFARTEQPEDDITLLIITGQ